MWGAFKDLHLLNIKTLEEVVALFKDYCITQIGKEVEDVFPSFRPRFVPTIKGFISGFWKGMDDRIIKTLIKSEIEIGKITPDQISFIFGNEEGFSLTVPCSKGFINHDKLQKEYLKALDLSSRKYPTQEKLSLLAFYLEKKDPEKLRYYELLLAIDLLGPLTVKQAFVSAGSERN